VIFASGLTSDNVTANSFTGGAGTFTTLGASGLATLNALAVTGNASVGVTQQSAEMRTSAATCTLQGY